MFVELLENFILLTNFKCNLESIVKGGWREIYGVVRSWRTEYVILGHLKLIKNY